MAVEKLAASLFTECGMVEPRAGMQEYVSKSFIYRSNQDALALEDEDNIRRYVDSEDTSENVSEIDSILLMTEGETLRIQ